MKLKVIYHNVSSVCQLICLASRKCHFFNIFSFKLFKKGANVADDFPISFVFFKNKIWRANVFSKLLIYRHKFPPKYLVFLRLLISVAFHRVPVSASAPQSNPQTCSSSKQIKTVEYTFHPIKMNAVSSSLSTSYPDTWQQSSNNFADLICNCNSQKFKFQKFK
jgi:hypothetical protein